jgi:hypothetical protein
LTVHDVLHRLIYEVAPVALAAIFAGILASYCIHTVALQKEPAPGPSIEVTK